jgi:beta-lactamase superfamily II metal-dependent hydrolase
MPLIYIIQFTVEFYSIVLSPVFGFFISFRLIIILFSLLLPTQSLSQFMFEALSSFELSLIKFIDSLPGTPMVATNYNILLITALAAWGLIIANSNFISGRRKITASISALIISFLVFIPKPKTGISMVNAGHGLAVIISGKQGNLGFDLGSKSLLPRSLISSAYFSELNYLNALPPRQFVFSHYDADHINGIPELNKLKSAVEINDIDRAEIKLEPFDIMVFKTKGELKNTSNDNGYALDIRYNGKRVIALGDQDGSALYDLCKRMDEGPVDVLFSPHHGLSIDGVAMLIEYFSPHEMWASCGSENFPLPVQNIVEHYGVPLLHTAQGPLRFNFE